jgi:hypothetical protein
MNPFRSLPAMVISAVMLLSGAAQAMDIIQFDHITAKDRQNFLDSLSRDAETVLKQQGRSADATKVYHLFNDISPGSDLPLGVAELEMNLANERDRDAQKHIQNPNAPRVQVAHRIGQIGVVVENRNVQRIRPPIAVPASVRPARERALARVFFIDFCIHVSLQSNI